jgi:hypothetical protein
LLLLRGGIITLVRLLRVLLHLLPYGGEFLRDLSFGLCRRVMCRPYLGVWGVIFLASTAEEEEDEDADDGNYCGAADGAADDGTDGCG